MRLVGDETTKSKPFYHLKPMNQVDVKPDSYIALHPFAGNRKRCAPFDLGFLAKALKEKGHQILWLGSFRA